MSLKNVLKIVNEILLSENSRLQIHGQNRKFMIKKSINEIVHEGKYEWKLYEAKFMNKTIREQRKARMVRELNRSKFEFEHVTEQE